jgi:hypothetical protein
MAVMCTDFGNHLLVALDAPEGADVVSVEPALRVLVVKGEGGY